MQRGARSEACYSLISLSVSLRGFVRSERASSSPAYWGRGSRMKRQTASGQSGIGSDLGGFGGRTEAGGKPSCCRSLSLFTFCSLGEAHATGGVCFSCTIVTIAWWCRSKKISTGAIHLQEQCPIPSSSHLGPGGRDKGENTASRAGHSWSYQLDSTQQDGLNPAFTCDARARESRVSLPKFAMAR